MPRPAFTLLELLIVVIILSIVMVIAIPMFTEEPSESEPNSARIQKAIEAVDRHLGNDMVVNKSNTEVSFEEYGDSKWTIVIVTDPENDSESHWVVEEDGTVRQPSSQDE